MLCAKAHLPTKQNADSQKKRALSVSQKHHVLHKHLEKSCSCFALLSWLLLCWAARTCTLSPPMSCLCYTCLRRQNLFSCVHGPKSAPLSWLLLRFTACTCTLSLLCHVSALKVWETQIALAVVAGGTRQRRLNTKKALELKLSWIKFGPLSFHHINPHGDFLAPMGPLC